METIKQALIHQRYDRAYKMLLGNPRAFCRFMHSLVDEELVQKVRPEKIELANEIFVSKNFQDYESNLIYKVAFNKNYEAYFYILMEFQSTPDRFMALGPV